MTTIGDLDTSPDPVLAAARNGDGDAFQQLVAPHLRVLHLYCYRMLGSYVDAEDAMQESLLRAWRGLGGYEGRSPLRHWLYRIATTTCLKMIGRRAREPVSTDDVAWLQPYPDALLDRGGVDTGRRPLRSSTDAKALLSPSSRHYNCFPVPNGPS